MKHCVLSSCLFILFGYFIVILPYSMVNYGARYNNYSLADCELSNTTIESLDFLFSFDSIYEVQNCSKKVEICCNNKDYWIEYSKNNKTKCYYNDKCDIIPEIILDYTLNFLEISSFIAGVFFSICLIYYCETRKNREYTIIN